MISAAELVRVRMPLRRSLASAHGTETVREVVLVRLVADDGVEGWGECSALEAPTYTGEYTDGAWAVLRDHLVPPLLGRGPATAVVQGHPMAVAAVGAAGLDLDLRRRGVSLATALGAVDGHGLAWTAVLGLPGRGESQLLLEAAAARAAGAGALKLKITPACGPDLIAALLDAFPDGPLAVDGNGSFRGHEPELIEVAERLATSGSSGGEGPAGSRSDVSRIYVEQPLPADDLLGTADLARRLAVPVALDESIGAAGDVVAAWALGACRLVNLKPARVGGIDAAMGLFDGDRPFRPAAFLGGMLETGIGRATALAVGGALGLAATDLGPSSWYFDDDITDPIELGADRLMRPPPGPGIGVVPRPERLAAVAVDRLLIRP